MKKRKAQPRIEVFEQFGPISFEVHDTTKDVSKVGMKLKGDWCECGAESEFLCYPEDGCCTCGCYKHHVHCAKCGCISQVG